MFQGLAVLTVLMVFLGHCRDFYYINDFQTTAYYQCYKQQGSNQASVYVEPNQPGSIEESIRNMRNAKNAGLELEVLLMLR